jgi:hypothetical protein
LPDLTPARLTKAGAFRIQLIDIAAVRRFRSCEAEAQRPSN